MISDQLLAHYDQISDIPDAVPRLREFILNLAVRGKLVPQDPDDEPASKLLEEITAEKTRLEAAGNTKRSSPETKDAPFRLPSGWAWSTIGSICSKTGSGSTPKGGKGAYEQSGVVFLRSQNVYDDGLRLNQVAYIDRATHQRMAGTAVKTSDLLLNITGGSIGRCCIVPKDLGDANVSQHVAIIRTAIDGPQRFLHCLMRSPYFQAFIFDEQTGAGRGGLPKNRMDRIPVALPPLAEQHRIVAKVDEIMELCDRLETVRSRRETTRNGLATATLCRLNNADTDQWVFKDHAHFAIDNLPVLTARRDQIEAIRQTILGLAVRGKLVPQDHNDEPPSELLKRISSGKVRSAKKGKIRGKASIGRRKHPNLGFQIPTTWTSVTLGEISNVVMGQSPPGRTYNTIGQGVPLINGPVEFSEGPFGETVVNQYTTSPTHLCNQGDFLICVRGSTTGRSNVAAFQACIGRGVAAIQPLFDDSFVRLFLWSMRKAIISMGRGIAFPSVSRTQLEDFPVPFPPLAEQLRIVAKVDELMDLCDRLEASLAAGEDIRSRLLESFLYGVLEGIEHHNEGGEPIPLQLLEA